MLGSGIRGSEVFGVVPLSCGVDGVEGGSGMGSQGSLASLGVCSGDSDVAVLVEGVGGGCVTRHVQAWCPDSV